MGEEHIPYALDELFRSERVGDSLSVAHERSRKRYGCDGEGGIHSLPRTFRAAREKCSIISLKLPSARSVSLPRTWSTTQETIRGLTRSSSAIAAESSMEAAKNRVLPPQRKAYEGGLCGESLPRGLSH